MNANELADALDKLDTKIMIEGINPNDLLSAELCDQAATMLRQQQKEIEELRNLSLRRENLGYFYDLHAIQQAEIEALKKKIVNLEFLARREK